jgi:hypothetical protein
VRILASGTISITLHTMQLKRVKTGHYVEMKRSDENEWRRWNQHPVAAKEARRLVDYVKKTFFNLPVAKGQMKVKVDFRIVRLRITEEVLKIYNLGSE